MKRKNKRHDSSKGSPEKSPEKPSRRSNRHSKRRRKSSSSSSSPDREREKIRSKTSKEDVVVSKDNLSSSKSSEKVRSYTPELVTEKINKEVVENEAGSSKRSSKRHTGGTGNELADSTSTSDKLAQIVKKDEGGGDDNEWKEDKSFWEGDQKVEESGDNKGKEKDSGSVWKVQSANGAGGEIQKIKICRQRMADSQSQDELPNSPKRRSSRIKDLSQRNTDEGGSENEDTDSKPASVDSTSTKLIIRTRTSSRSSPALLDSPKVVCDVSEDNPTRIKIHIESKSPDKAPLISPVLSSKDKSEEIGVVDSKDQAESNFEGFDNEKELNKTDEPEKTEIVVENEKVVEKEEGAKTAENNDGLVEESAKVEIETPEGLPKEETVVVDKQPEQEDNVVILDVSEIVVADTVELVDSTAVETTEEKETNNETKSEDAVGAHKDEQPPRRSSSSQSPSPRREEKEYSSSTSGSSSDDSNDSDSNDSDSNGKKVKRKKRRKDGMQSTVTRQPRVATESHPAVAECAGEEEKSGKQEPEEEGEVREGEAVEEAGGAVEAKATPVASDKENSVAVISQPSSVSGPAEPVQRKRRWGASKSIRPAKKPVLCISTDSLKNLIPEAKPVSIEEVRLSVDEDGDKDSDAEEREKSSEAKEILLDDSKLKREKKEVKRDKGKERERDKERIRGEKEVKDIKDEKKPTKEKKEPAKVVLADKPATVDKVNRRICVLSEDARKLVRSPSPARHRPSNVLYITNLVRPFTIPQLRNLLARTGKIAENGFWIDKIKSKCYVQYTDEEAAIETRHALHGVRWPVSNPRTLCVEFASYDDMAVAQALSEETEPIPRKAEPLQVDHSVEGWLADQARINVDRSQRRVVREWDVGKPAHPDEELDMRPSRPDYDDIRDRERERERDRDRRIKKERHRSRTPDPHEPLVRKPRRKDEDAPAKLLDDLFRKTKTSPCIYWLPLTAEQIVVKEEMRRQHMAEHERRVAEMKKAEQARRDRERRRK